MGKGYINKIILSEFLRAETKNYLEWDKYKNSRGYISMLCNILPCLKNGKNMKDSSLWWKLRNRKSLIGLVINIVEDFNSLLILLQLTF